LTKGNAVASVVVAGLLMLVPRLLPIVEYPDALSVGLLAGVLLAPLVLVAQGSPHRRPVALGLALAGGAAAVVGLLRLILWVKVGHPVPPLEWRWLLGAAGVAALCWVAAFAVARLRAAPGFALLLAAVLPATANMMPNPTPLYDPLTLSALVAATLEPSPETFERYFDWIHANNREALFAAGSKTWRGPDCMQDVAWCPDLPDLPRGEPGPMEVVCTAAWRRCTATRIERYHTPPYELIWQVETDLEGRFSWVNVTVESSTFRGPLPPWPDLWFWLQILPQSLLSGVLLCGAVGLGLWLGTSPDKGSRGFNGSL
jgi:hypothetical protein